jgi:carbon-monoxide dehydrogenase large subunit
MAAERPHNPAEGREDFMDAINDQKYAVGQPVYRKEDPTLVQGKGRYTDDVNLPGQVYAAIVRSAVAHGVIKGIDTDAAREMPGVLAIYTAADLDAAGYGSLKCIVDFPNKDGSPIRKPVRKALAGDKVRFVGDPVACVVAESRAQAQDAAEAVVVDIDELPAVTKGSEAFKPGAPLLYDEVPNNCILDYYHGDGEKVAEAFAKAAHVAKLELINNRLVIASMEPRGAIAEYDPAGGKFTMHMGCQGAFGMRNQLADVMNLSKDKVRVLTGHVGGSFGMKAGLYPEYVPLMHAARALGRPVKWIDARSTAFLSDHHGRDHEFSVELALDKDGKFLACRAIGYGNMGAYLSLVSPMMATRNIVRNMVSFYDVPFIEVSTKCVATNTTTVSAYRGAGRPEGNYYMERLIDTAAAEMGIDRVELRRKNLIQPEKIPYKAASGETYDSGDFPGVFDDAVRLGDLGGFARRRAESKAKGLIRGLGIGCYLEVTAPPGPEMGGIRFEDDGTVTFITGTLDYGQGHATPFAQVLSEKLGIPFDKIKLLQGDSDQLIAGGGTGGSRSMYASGHAIVEASGQVIEKGKKVAAELLEAGEGDIEFRNGRFTIAGTDRSIAILDLAETLRKGNRKLPEGVPDSLDVSHATGIIPSAYPNGVHVCEVEIDPELGNIEIVKYLMVSDFGTIINPMLVEGQCHGGVVQGIGQAILEHAVYDSSGQPLTGTFMDYAMPRAEHAPDFRFASHPVPAKTNALGVKGCGEAGCAGSITSIMNAISDALTSAGAKPVEMPATPEKVWQALSQAKAA